MIIFFVLKAGSDFWDTQWVTRVYQRRGRKPPAWHVGSRTWVRTPVESNSQPQIYACVKVRMLDRIQVCVQQPEIQVFLSWAKTLTNTAIRVRDGEEKQALRERHLTRIHENRVRVLDKLTFQPAQPSISVCIVQEWAMEGFPFLSPMQPHTLTQPTLPRWPYGLVICIYFLTIFTLFSSAPCLASKTVTRMTDPHTLNKKLVLK